MIEKDDVRKGLVELVAQRGITQLVMGAAADKYYSRYSLQNALFKLWMMKRLLPSMIQEFSETSSNLDIRLLALLILKAAFKVQNLICLPKQQNNR